MARFAAFLKANPNFSAPMQVVLHSPGGDLLAGIRLGRMLRAGGFDTNVGRTVAARQTDDGVFFETGVRAGECSSACAYAFLGGIKRNVDTDSRLGFHQFFALNQADQVVALGNAVGLSQLQLISALIVSYIIEMGVDGRLIEAASSAGPNSMVYPKPEKLRELNILPVRGFTSWHLSMSGNGLRVLSNRFDSTYHVYEIEFSCTTPDSVPRMILHANDASGGLALSLRPYLAKSFTLELAGKKYRVPEGLTGLDYGSEGQIRLSVYLDRGLDDYVLVPQKIGATFSPYNAAGFYNVQFELGETTIRMARIAFRNCV